MWSGEGVGWDNDQWVWLTCAIELLDKNDDEVLKVLGKWN